MSSAIDAVVFDVGGVLVDWNPRHLYRKLFDDEDLQAAGVPCYALTNIEAETYPLRLERFPFWRSFDGIVVSAHEGVAKPDAEIFRRLLERYRLDPPTTLMIDDAPANVAAAAELGMRTLRFESAAQLRRRLEDEGLL